MVLDFGHCDILIWRVLQQSDENRTQEYTKIGSTKWLFYIDNLVIELPENMLIYILIYVVIEILNELYQERSFWPCRPALVHPM